MNGPNNGHGQRPPAQDPTKPHAPAPYGKPTSLRQVVDLQSAMHEAALLLKDDAKTAASPASRARASLALGALGQSWVRLQDAKRVILGRPGPGNLRPEAPPKYGRRRPRALPAPFLEIEEATPQNVPRGTISPENLEAKGEPHEMGTPKTPTALDEGTPRDPGEAGGIKGISFGAETVPTEGEGEGAGNEGE